MMKRNKNNDTSTTNSIDTNGHYKKNNNGKYEKLIDSANSTDNEDINIFQSNDVDDLRKSMQNISNYKCDFGCHFDKKTQEEIEKAKKARKKLLMASAFCVLFMIAELIGGFMAQSIALMSDALHLLSDCGGLMISVVALVSYYFIYCIYIFILAHKSYIIYIYVYKQWMSQKGATNKLTYGYHRAEIVGALFSVFLIWGLTIWLVYEAIDRMINPTNVDGKIMFIVACCGIIVNIAMSGILHQGHGHHHHGHGHGHGHGHSHGHNHGHKHDHNHSHDHSHSHHSHEMSSKSSKQHEHKEHDDHKEDNHNHNDDNNNKKEHNHSQINVRSAFIHALGDLLQSIGVLIASALIWYDESKFRIADPICTLLFSIIVIFTTVNLMRDILSVLMESVPSHLDYTEISMELKQLTDVAQVHDLHVWNLSLGKPSLSVHLLVQSSTLDSDGKIIPACADAILRNAQNVLENKFDIHHSTIQIEWPHSDNINKETSCPSYCKQQCKNDNHDPISPLSIQDDNHHHDHHDHHDHNYDHNHDHNHDHHHEHHHHDNNV